jgi:hypothetical protein
MLATVTENPCAANLKSQIFLRLVKLVKSVQKWPSVPRRLESLESTERGMALPYEKWSKKWKSHSTANIRAVFVERMP